MSRFYGSFFVQSFDDRGIFADSRISDVAEGYSIDAVTRYFVVLPVETHFHVEQSSFLNAFYPDVPKQNVANVVLVTAVYRHATLVGRGVFIVFQNIYVTENQVLNHLSRRRVRVAMTTYVDRMRYICPKYGVLHSDVARAAPPVPAVVLKGYAVIRVTHKEVHCGNTSDRYHHSNPCN